MSRGQTFAFDSSVSWAGARTAMAQMFAEAGITTPDLDARLLLCWVLDVDAAMLIAHRERPLGAKAAALTTAANRRLAREPVSRILGVRDFYGRTFQISPATLDPRPDTETLIDGALDYVKRHQPTLPLRILDIGTGTGCLLITLLAELPQATGLGTDVSPAALALAAANAARLGVSSRAQWKLADALDGVDGTFDLIVTNPPYIPSGVIPGLEPEVRLFDPLASLDGGADGMAIYRSIVAGISLVLPEGCAFFEVGHDQAAALITLLEAQATARQWPTAEQRLDLAGHVRCVMQITRRFRDKKILLESEHSQDKV